MGEALFESLCAEVGLTANKATNDDQGWDYIVEFPRAFESDLAIDSPGAPKTQCKVQVKSTGQNKKSWQVELSNLHSLCTDTLPAFYFFIHYDQKSQPAEAYLYPVGNDIIHDVFNKITENNSTQNPKKLNKIKKTISYTGFKLSEVKGEQLKKRLLNFIGANFAGYIESKARLLNKIKREQSQTKINFGIPRNQLNLFLESMIGLNKQAEVINIIGTETKFGVDRDIPELRSSGARVSMTNLTPYQGKLYFRRDPLLSPVVFEARLFSPPFIFFESDFYKIRFESDFFDIVVSPNLGKLNLSLKLDEGAVFDLKKAKAFLDLLICTDALSRCYVEFKSASFKDKLTFSMSTNSEELLALSEIHLALRDLLTVFDFFDYEQDFNINFVELEYLAPKARDFVRVVNEKNPVLKVKYTSEEVRVKSIKEAWVFQCFIQVGQYSFVAIYTAVGQPSEHEGGVFTMRADEVVVEQKLTLSSTDTSLYPAFVDRINAVEEKYADEYRVVSFIDKNKILELHNQSVETPQ